MSAMALRRLGNVDARLVYRTTREVVRNMVNAQVIPIEREEQEYQRQLAQNLRKHGLPVPQWLRPSPRPILISSM